MKKVLFPIALSTIFLSTAPTAYATITSPTSVTGQMSDDGLYYGYIKQEGGYTNIRKSPNGAIAMKIKDGTKIYYARTSSDWWKVYNTNYAFLGYVHRSKIVND